MSSSSGNSAGSGSNRVQNSGSEEELQGQMMEQRKRKRMQSNRESARRSRMRKQKHLDDLTGQMNQLKKENEQILTNINITTQFYLNVESENSVLRAQMEELGHRLQSLNEILNYINTNTTTTTTTTTTNNSNNNRMFDDDDIQIDPDSFIYNDNHWNPMHLNQQPIIMASVDSYYHYHY